MIRMLTGTVAATSPSGVVLDVRGVGYLVRTTALERDVTIGHEISYHTYLAVRETALDLYGFTRTSDRDVFELLLTVPKIGPKSALQILDQASVELLKEAVATQDPARLSKIGGVGKKTAESLVQQLKDKFDDVFVADETAFGAVVFDSKATQDAFDALVALGYTPSEVRSHLKEAPTEASTNDLVKQALKELS